MGGVVEKQIPSDSVINVPRREAALRCGGTLFSSHSERGQQRGRGAGRGCIVTAVRIRQSDCRHSKQDVTYPSAGILLLPPSSSPRRKKKKEKKVTEISYEIIPKSTRHSGSWCQWLRLHVDTATSTSLHEGVTVLSRRLLGEWKISNTSWDIEHQSSTARTPYTKGALCNL